MLRQEIADSIYKNLPHSTESEAKQCRIAINEVCDLIGKAAEGMPMILVHPLQPLDDFNKAETWAKAQLKADQAHWQKEIGK